MFNSLGPQWMFDTDIHPGVVTQSARFSDTNNKYLQRTDSTTPTSTQKFTFSCWLKNWSINSGDTIFGSDKGTAGGPGDAAWIQFTTNRRLNIYNITGASYNLQWTSDAMYRDVTNWYHFVIRVDTTQGSADDRVRLYVNGTQQTGSYATTVGQNNNVSFNNAAGKFRIAGLGYADGYEGDFYLADVHHCDGYSYAPTEFGEDKNGVWIPKIASVSYGNTGYRLEFKNSTVGSTSGSSSTIGADTSGNGHHFNDYNMGTDDSNIPDCPENNFCTVNSNRESTLVNGSVTLSEGNLQSVDGGTTYGVHWTGTFGITTGRWYWEIYVHTMGGSYASIGLTNRVERSTTAGTAVYYNNGGTRNPQASTPFLTAYGATYTNGDVIGIAFNADNETVTFFKNNVSQGAVDDVLTKANGPYFAAVGDGQNSTTYKYVANFGQDDTFAGNLSSNGNTGGGGKFYYTPPAGFNALCSNALEDGIISPNPSASSAPTDYFNTVLYTGNDGTQTITGVGFQPDWVWIKARNQTRFHNVFDSVRGTGRNIRPNANNAEVNDNDTLTAFATDGFSLGNDGTGARGTNYSTDNYVAWCWKAGGAPTASNTAGVGEAPTAGSVLIDGKETTAPLAGSIKIDKLSANTISGFSIVTYTANSNTQCTLPHGLNSAPNMVIIKNRDASSNGQWVIGQDQNGFTGQLYLDDGGAFSSNSGSFANTAPTSSVVTINTDNTVNEGTDEFVMYCFHNVEGFSKIGSYTGNNSTDGPFAYTGFRPAWIMLKRTNDSGSFQLLDDKRNPSNPTDLYLYTPGTGAEVDGSGLGTPIIVDFLSNGFKVRSTEAVYNSSGGRFLYLAFASADFKTSNAR